MRKKIYVGLWSLTGKREIIRSEKEVTETTHGDLYAAVIGPFKTVRGAQYCVEFPHAQCTTVKEFERFAAVRLCQKQLAKDYIKHLDKTIG
jgi:hypothetical protein